MASNKHEMIRTLGLEPHIEGGYFRRTFSSQHTFRRSSDNKERLLLSSIYYLLTDDRTVSYMVSNEADIVRFFHVGSPITFYVVTTTGNLKTYTLGNDIQNGHVLQVIAEGGTWTAAVLERGEYALISEAVGPGFEYEDMKLIRRENVKRRFPHLLDQISHLLVD